MSAPIARSWTVIEGKYADRVIDAEGNPIAIVANGVVPFRAYEAAVVKSNGLVLAAAPDLLAACRAMRATCPCDPDINPQWYAAWELMQAAITKAGVQP